MINLKDYPNKSQLAASLGVSRAAVYHWASGRSSPAVDMRERLRALDIELPAVTPPPDPLRIRDINLHTETVLKYLRILDTHPNGYPASWMHAPTRGYMRDTGLIELFYAGKDDKRTRLRPVASYRITAKGREVLKELSQ